VNPGWAEAHYNLANAWRAQFMLDEAIGCYHRALELKPDYAEAHVNLGNSWKDQGNLTEAEACYRRALELAPGLAVVHSNLGNVLQEQGHQDAAVACFRRAVMLQPDYAEAHNNLGQALRQEGQLDEAAAECRRALELNPDFAAAHNNLGNALQEQRRLDDAVACYRRALELQPGFAEAHHNLGQALREQGKLDEAIACFRRAVDLKPDYAEAFNHLGSALRDQGNLDDAVAACRRALALKPDHVEALNELGNALHGQGKLDEAVVCYRRALDLMPGLPAVHNNLGEAFKGQGKLEDAVACFRRALELKPDYASAHSNLLYTLHYCGGVTLAALAEEHAVYDRLHAAPLYCTIALHENSRDRHRRLRVGFVSPDLGRHPVGFFLVRVLENLNPESVETICYSDRRRADELTCRLQAAATAWRDVTGSSDARLAEQIREDRIDILFDLTGHSGYNRLLVFARKPAPIQITWIGYEGTTGLVAMDYLLADRHVVPEGSERFCRERVLRMPDGYLCYDPPAAAPSVSRLPALESGEVTFGSFNNLAKITPEVVAVWAAILRAAPSARLVMKYRGMGDATVKQRYLDLFAAQEVDPNRLDLRPWGSYADYLATYQEVDLALDPFPFSGSTVTCESLWMGVPVLTCPGATFASRHSLTHLSNLGLTETIARDVPDYLNLAVSWAGDLPRLAALRSGLRERMAASPLCDGKRFATNVASLLKDVWERWIG
jgi:predicted O-linked N-acetylglucosamine transferase (SPINDLY family)